MHQLKEARLIRGFAQVTISSKPEAELNGNYSNPWAFIAEKDSGVVDIKQGALPIRYELSPLVRDGHQLNLASMTRHFSWRESYTLLKAAKEGWGKTGSTQIPLDEQLTQPEIDEFQELMEQIKQGRVPINNELQQPVNPDYLAEIADFLSPRIPHIRAAYIGNLVYASAARLEALNRS